MIEHSARMAEHQDRLSLHAADIANLLRESDFWARQAGAKLIQDLHDAGAERVIVRSDWVETDAEMCEQLERMAEAVL